jgi:PhnB protein
MKTLNPYLTFEGNCREAMEYYKKALNPELFTLQSFEEAHQEVADAYKKHIIHSELKADGVHFMASDGMPGWKAVSGNNVTMSIDFSDGAEQEKIWKVLAEGGKITMPMQDTFWGARFGMLTDRFGIQWMLNFTKPK